LYGRAAWLRSRGYSRAYLFKRSFSSALLVRLAGIPWRVGHVAEGRGWLLSRAVAVRRGRHQAESYLDLLRDDGIDVDDGYNENWQCERDRGLIDRLLADVPAGRPRVFLAMRSTNREKHWRIDRWADVIEWLVAVRGCEVFFCGGPRDADMHAQVIGLLDPKIAAHVHDHSDSVSLRQVGGLLARMDLCMGVDSGLPHIAASYGVPVGALFGPTDPRQWHPWKTASEVVCGSRAAAQGGGSMLAIDVEQVTAAAERLLTLQAQRQPTGRPKPVPELQLCDVGMA
jgi:heptosyltransferase-2